MADANMKDTCSRYPIERLSAAADGDLPPAEAQAVRAHVDACPRCAPAMAELRMMVTATHALDAPEPPPTLWAAIEGGLERQERRSWLAWRPFSVGALAGAFAVVLLAAGLPALRARTGGTVASAPAPEVAAAVVHDPLLYEAEAEFAQAAAAYERSIEKLRSLLAREESRWSPEERTRYSERVERLDDATARSRELARRSPGDSAGNEQLLAAYQQKIAFLSATVHRGGEAGEWIKTGGARP
jgi:Putative zinc-finger